MAYSLTYSMSTGQGVRISETAIDAVFDHAGLLCAGASGIVIRDAKLSVIPLASLTLLSKAFAKRIMIRR